MLEYVGMRDQSGLRGPWRKSLDILVLEGLGFFALYFGDFDFGDFGVSFAATVAWRYTRWGGPRLSVQGEPLIVLTLYI